MKNSKSVRSLVLAASLAGVLLVAGCVGNAIASQAKYALDAGSQTALGAVINNSPQDFAQFEAVYPLLYTIPAGQLSSYTLGQTVAKADVTGKSALDLTNALDAAVRNTVQAQGGSAGSATLDQAIAQQVLGVVADGYWHALNNFAGAHGLPAVPQYVPSGAVNSASGQP